MSSGLDSETTPSACYDEKDAERCLQSARLILERARILVELKRLAADLRRDFAIDAVYVFGSFARRAEHEGSDIDLLVVGELPGRVFDRVGEVLRRTTLPVEPIVVSAATFHRHCREEHPLFSTIAREGLPLS